MAAAIEPTNKQYSFAMRTASNAASGGKGSLGSQPGARRAAPAAFGQQRPSAGTPNAEPAAEVAPGGQDFIMAIMFNNLLAVVDGQVSARLSQIEARLESLEEKVSK